MSCLFGHIKNKSWHRIKKKLGLRNDIDDFIGLAETSYEIGHVDLALDRYRMAAEYYPEYYDVIDGVIKCVKIMENKDIELVLSGEVAFRED